MGGLETRGYIVLYKKGCLSTYYEIIYICSIFLVPIATKFYYVTIIQYKHTANTKELEDFSNTLLLAWDGSVGMRIN